MQPTSRHDTGLTPPRATRPLSRSVAVVRHWNGGPVDADVYAGDPEAERRYLRAVQRNHMTTNRLAVGGAADVAYNHAIGMSGTLYELRGDDIQGAHCPGMNHQSHGVLLMLGNGQKLTAAAARTLADYVERHQKRYGTDRQDDHRDHRPTTCPGNQIASLNTVSKLRDYADTVESSDAAPERPTELPSRREWVTLGDTGSRVLEWQELLAELLPDHPDAHRPDGDFGPLTKRLTLAAYELVELTASDPDRPRVGRASVKAVENKLDERRSRQQTQPSPPAIEDVSRPVLRLTEPMQRGDKVRYLQQRIERFGFDAGSSGIYGPRTERGVRQFQASARITVDGIVGPQTWAALANFAGDRTPELGRLLYNTSPMQRGEDVEKLQQRLASSGHSPGRADGVFGPATESAVRRFQMSAGITVDGIVGPETWGELWKR